MYLSTRSVSSGTVRAVSRETCTLLAASSEVVAVDVAVAVGQADIGGEIVVENGDFHIRLGEAGKKASYLRCNFRVSPPQCEHQFERARQISKEFVVRQDKTSVLKLMFRRPTGLGRHSCAMFLAWLRRVKAVQFGLLTNAKRRCTNQFCKRFSSPCKEAPRSISLHWSSVLWRSKAWSNQG